jgi:hypothetical protein
VRNPLFEYAERQSFHGIESTPGPKSNNYPADCIVEDTLIHETGRVEKQTAGVQISMSEGITVRHCSIYDVPRAGININEGTFGGMRSRTAMCSIRCSKPAITDRSIRGGATGTWGLKDIDLNLNKAWSTSARAHWQATKAEGI